jgi:hypothetical protein
MTDQDKIEQSKKALALIKEVHDDGIAEINGREYEFTKTTHKKRRKIFAFYSRVTPLIEKRDFSFLDWPEWDILESVIGDIILHDGIQLSKSKDHWEKYPSDYLQFISVVLPVLAYPFLAGNGGD